jgi:hypothetical protein
VADSLPLLVEADVVPKARPLSVVASGRMRVTEGHHTCAQGYFVVSLEGKVGAGDTVLDAVIPECDRASVHPVKVHSQAPDAASQDVYSLRTIPSQRTARYLS